MISTQVRAEIQSFRNRSVTVLVSDACCLCDIALLLRPFYLFPCGHKFHSDCLTTETLPILSKYLVFTTLIRKYLGSRYIWVGVIHGLSFAKSK